ncbi:DUF4974 domain-containing protein [Flavobacteriaceae bacterium F08102]|nr:DUF4974 domain-containing protein [Flavobacteriaceae bacterium F08102]
MNKEHQEKLADLLQKFQEGTATNAEIEQLANFYVNHQGSEEWPHDLHLKGQVKEKIFSKIESKFKKNQRDTGKVIPLFQRRIFKYAVAASIAILIAIPIFLINKAKIKNSPNQEVTNIQSGTDKATLTLGDGSEILLEKGKTFQANNLRSNGKQLVYNAHENEEDRTKITYNYLSIPRGGQFFVKLEDGTQVWLNSESKLKFPTKFIDGQKRVVELIYGEAYFDVSSSTHHKGSRFKVVAKGQDIEVLGTEFNIRSYKNQDSNYTTLIEGEVNVGNNNSIVKISPGQQSVVNKNGIGSISVWDVDVRYEIAWKNGLFMFHKESLESILETLSRWYDLEVVFKTEEKKREVFSGMLKRTSTVTELLNNIEKTGDVKFIIENGRITVK